MGGVTGYDYIRLKEEIPSLLLRKVSKGALFAQGIEGRYVQKSETRAQNLKKMVQK